MMERHIRSVERYREKVLGRMQSALFAVAVKADDEERGRPKKHNRQASNGMEGKQRSKRNGTLKNQDMDLPKKRLAPGGAVWI